MGVMGCDRNGCENIMCTKYNEEQGFICNECFEELVQLGPTHSITSFMNSKKTKNFDIVLEANRKYFDKLFTGRY
jgi:hypothetical protein